MTQYAKIAYEMGKEIAKDAAAVGTLVAATATPLVPEKAFDWALDELGASELCNGLIGYLSGYVEMGGGVALVLDDIFNNTAKNSGPLAAAGYGLAGAAILVDGAARMYKAFDNGYNPTFIPKALAKGAESARAAAGAVKDYFEGQYERAAEKVGKEPPEPSEPPMPDYGPDGPFKPNVP